MTTQIIRRYPEVQEPADSTDPTLLWHVALYINDVPQGSWASDLESREAAIDAAQLAVSMGHGAIVFAETQAQRDAKSARQNAALDKYQSKLARKNRGKR